MSAGVHVAMIVPGKSRGVVRKLGTVDVFA
jgi:hypothetical protein